MLLESSVMTIQTVAHFSIKFHPHQCVTLVPDEQERGSGGVLHTQGHVDTQKYRYCKSLFKFFSACSSPRYRVPNIVHNSTRIFWNFRGEMFITHIFNYTFWYVSEINSATVMISVLTVGKTEAWLTWSAPSHPSVPAEPPSPHTATLFRGTIATSGTMRRFYLTERLPLLPSLQVTSHLQELRGSTDIQFHDSFKAIRNVALKLLHPPHSFFTSGDRTASRITLSMSVDIEGL